jgi:hypothetical protein
LRVAAQNLKMAEEHTLVRQLMGKAEAMEREVQEGKKRLAAGSGTCRFRRWTC